MMQLISFGVHQSCFLIQMQVSPITTVFFSELCWGKAMVAYTMPQQRNKEESEGLRGERDQIKFIDVGFERWQFVRFRKARGMQDVHNLLVLGMNDALWDRVRGVGTKAITRKHMFVI